MKIEDGLKEIIDYYRTTRQIGHTTLMKVGTNDFNRDKLVLVLGRDHGDSMGIKRSEMVTLDNLQKLRGSNAPLVIDNGVLIEIFDQTYLKVDSLKEETKRHKSNYITTRKELSQSEYKVYNMRSHPFKTFFKTIFGLWQH